MKSIIQFYNTFELIPFVQVYFEILKHFHLTLIETLSQKR